MMYQKICENPVSGLIDRIERIGKRFREDLGKKDIYTHTALRDFWVEELKFLPQTIQAAREGQLSSQGLSNALNQMTLKGRTFVRSLSLKEEKEGTFWGDFKDFDEAVGDLRKILAASSGANAQVLYAAIAIKDATSKETAEELARIENKLDDGHKKIRDIVRKLKESVGNVHDGADKLVEDVLACVECKKISEDREELEEALSAVRCQYCEILCEVNLLQGAEQLILLVELEAELATIGVAIESALREFDKICVTEKSCADRLQPVLAKISAGIQAVQTAFSNWAGERLGLGVEYQTATANISAAHQKILNAVANLGPNPSRDALCAVLSLVGGLSEGMRQLYCKAGKLEHFDTRVFALPWSLLVQVRCILEPCCEEEDECDDLKKQLSRFFCLWKDLSGRFEAVDCEHVFDPEKDYCCAPSGIAATRTPVYVTALAPQLNAYWATAQSLIANLKSISPRLKDDIAEKWTAQAQSEIMLLKKGPVAANIPPDILLSQAQREWSELYAKLSVIVAVEKDAGDSAKGAQLDAFNASLSLLNQQMLSAFGQTAPTPVSVAASGGAQS